LGKRGSDIPVARALRIISMLNKADITAHFERANARPSRALGQNFVADANTVRKIVRLADIEATTQVVEIGAGLGSLTLAIAETGAKVTAVEIDRYLIDQLTENTRAHSNVTIVHADAMKINWDELLPPENATEDATYTLIANLPYNVGTPLVADLLDFAPQITRMLVMVQKEVGERFAAKPREKAYGAVSVKVAYHGEAKVVGLVPPSVFVPQPNVDSALVRIDRHQQPAVDSNLVTADRLFEVVKAGFGQRRKMLRGNLAGIVSPDAFARAGVAPTARAEELSLAEWSRLAAL
jgi:16S rRNA (adenine1518-N6/adenine1519-N6)-dimethyltransferase